jgi:hypothetical protein
MKSRRELDCRVDVVWSRQSARYSAVPESLLQGVDSHCGRGADRPKNSHSPWVHEAPIKQR